MPSPFLSLKLKDPRFAGRVCQRAGDEKDGRVPVRVIGLEPGAPCIRVKPQQLEALPQEGIEACPMCLDPLCERDSPLMCGHRLHVSCLAKRREERRQVSCPR
eukprot:Hpha_TRINITY_DN28768_c0_g1::TRINITY_DN28768_c0_g1_i1::g.42462::m.42462